VRSALRRWACVVAVGGAVLAEVASAGAGTVAIATNEPFLSPHLNDSPPLSSDAARRASDTLIDQCVRGDGEITEPADPVADVSTDVAPVAAFTTVTNEQMAAGTPVAFPAPAPASVQPAHAAVAEVPEFDDAGNVGRVPPATVIPLPPGLWTGLAGLGGLGFISAVKRIGKSS
jgi:hypothetical protein